MYMLQGMTAFRLRVR